MTTVLTVHSVTKVTFNATRHSASSSLGDGGWLDIKVVTRGYSGIDSTSVTLHTFDLKVFDAFVDIAQATAGLSEAREAREVAQGGEAEGAVEGVPLTELADDDSIDF